MKEHEKKLSPPGHGDCLAANGKSTKHDSTATEDKRSFLGNAWYVSASYNFARNGEFMVNLGRTHYNAGCGYGGCIYQMFSGGFGFSRSKIEGSWHNTASVFVENAITPMLPLTVRYEYLYDMTAQQHYMRPSIGLCFYFVDIQYNYSFMLVGETNAYRHGFSVRLKYFPGHPPMEDTRPAFE